MLSMTTGIDQLLRNLLNTCGALDAEAAKALHHSGTAPTALAKLTTWEHIVCVHLGTPPRARVVVQNERGETRVIYSAEGARFPVALGHASAAIVEAGVNQLNNRTRLRLAALQRIGYSLGLVIWRDSAAVEVIVGKDDGCEPVTIATLRHGDERCN